MITVTPGHLTTSPQISPKNDPKAEFYILVPLFALLGIILWSMAAWLVYGCLMRKPRVWQPFGGEEKVIRDVDVEDGDTLAQ
jgi:hypothetical protein